LKILQRTFYRSDPYSIPLYKTSKLKRSDFNIIKLENLTECRPETASKTDFIFHLKTFFKSNLEGFKKIMRLFHIDEKARMFSYSFPL